MAKKKKKKKSKFKKLKSDLNIPFLILGLLFLLFGFIKSADINENKLQQMDVVLSTKMKSITGTRGLYSYKFWTKKNNAEFVIERGIKISNDFKDFMNLTENDVVTIRVDNNSYDFTDKLEQIPIYSLEHNGKKFISLENFITDNKMYNLRYKIISLFGGIILLFNAFSLLKVRQTLVLIGLFFIAILIMRVFEFGIYTKN
jgi:hypothetical protein